MKIAIGNVYIYVYCITMYRLILVSFGFPQRTATVHKHTSRKQIRIDKAENVCRCCFWHDIVISKT